MIMLSGHRAEAVLDVVDVVDVTISIRFSAAHKINMNNLKATTQKIILYLCEYFQSVAAAAETHVAHSLTTSIVIHYTISPRSELVL